ncbi:MAG: thiamine-phosphate kinase [Gammaproteobacteria bacterium]
MTLHEFDIIAKYFSTQAMQRDDVVLDIGDDCAMVEVAALQQLVITTDTLVAGVHFPINTSAYDIGYKSLAVNLSDLAAMGATPAWFTLALTMPDANEKWLEKFSQGLFAIADRYQIQLIGGDLTRGPLTITITAHGLVPKNQALKRSGAQVGDLIYVTHTLGDAALGLLSLQNKITIASEYKDFIYNKLNRPEPRIETGLHLRNIANAAIDISDGLIADLTHILEMSHVGATVYIDDLPISAAVRQSTSDHLFDLALSGGDDYELCFTLPKDKTPLLKNDCTCIGVITEKSGLDLRFKDGTSYNRSNKGYQHF